MPRLSPEQLAQDWAKRLDRFPASVSRQVAVLAERQRHALASHFYEQMLQDPAASSLLSHDQVKNRLHDSMQRWIHDLFAVAEERTLVTALIAQQMKIGEIHARIEVPMHLVLRGARALKERLNELLQAETALAPALRFESTQLAGDLIDLAMEVMSYAYASSHDRNARAEEAYRLFSVAQNIGSEKERQRAALLSWENQLMFDLAVGLTPEQLPRLATAEFGLWFRHKGAHAFQGTQEAELILHSMQQIDEVLLPMFGMLAQDAVQIRQQHLRDLREHSRHIGLQLEHLFEQANQLESGRDALTRLLNRKFLPVVLSKEMGYAQQHGQQFAVLAIDIDHFKQINDNHGHEVGDQVLQQMAILLGNHSRGGDYVFRLGGEEFLMLLVDVDRASALQTAEKLRQLVSQELFRLPRDEHLQLSVSIGLAMHSGHPDYQHLLRRADEALYRAKRSGRNCVVHAEE